MTRDQRSRTMKGVSQGLDLFQSLVAKWKSIGQETAHIHLEGMIFK